MKAFSQRMTVDLNYSIHGIGTDAPESLRNYYVERYGVFLRNRNSTDTTSLHFFLNDVGQGLFIITVGDNGFATNLGSLVFGRAPAYGTWNSDAIDLHTGQLVRFGISNVRLGNFPDIRCFNDPSTKSSQFYELYPSEYFPLAYGALPRHMPVLCDNHYYFLRSPLPERVPFDFDIAPRMVCDVGAELRDDESESMFFSSERKLIVSRRRRTRVPHICIPAVHRYGESTYHSHNAGVMLKRNRDFVFSLYWVDQALFSVESWNREQGVQQLFLGELDLLMDELPLLPAESIRRKIDEAIGKQIGWELLVNRLVTMLSQHHIFRVMDMDLSPNARWLAVLAQININYFKDEFYRTLPESCPSSVIHGMRGVTIIAEALATHISNSLKSVVLLIDCQTKQISLKFSTAKELSCVRFAFDGLTLTAAGVSNTHSKNPAHSLYFFDGVETTVNAMHIDIDE